jgi:hypothetical protein
MNHYSSRIRTYGSKASVSLFAALDQSTQVDKTGAEPGTLHLFQSPGLLDEITTIDAAHAEVLQEHVSHFA